MQEMKEAAVEKEKLSKRQRTNKLCCLKGGQPPLTPVEDEGIQLQTIEQEDVDDEALSTARQDLTSIDNISQPHLDSKISPRHDDVVTPTPVYGIPEESSDSEEVIMHAFS